MLSLMGILNIEEDAAHFFIASISKLLILSKRPDALEKGYVKAIGIGEANNTSLVLYFTLDFAKNFKCCPASYFWGLIL